jgi:hypothetical protein
VTALPLDDRRRIQSLAAVLFMGLRPKLLDGNIGQPQQWADLAQNRNEPLDRELSTPTKI